MVYKASSMKLYRNIFAFLVASTTILFYAFPTHANPLTRCECSAENWVGICTASVELKDKWVTVLSSSKQCSRVDWYADSTPQVSIVTDGAEVESWIGQQIPKKITVDSCNICKDHSNPTPEEATNLLRVDKGQHACVGKWSGSSKNWFSTENVQFSILNNNGSLTGTYTGINGTTPISGKFNDNESCSFKPNVSGGGLFEFRVTDGDRAEFKWKGMGGGKGTANKVN